MTDESAGVAALREPDGGAAEGGPEEVRLSRDMTLFDATMLGVGALMGGGVFVLVGIAAGAAGPAVILAFALNALVTIPTLLVYAELGSASDDAGGGYLWVKNAIGQPWGFIGGWMSWFSHAVACALYTLASAAYLVWLLDYLDWVPGARDDPLLLKGVAAGFTLLFLALNYVGVKSSVRTENAITIVVLGILAAFIGFGLRSALGNPALVERNFADFMPNGTGGILLAMGLTFIAFEGYEIISQSSEEVKNPKRNIPRAIKLSLLVVAPIYLLVVFVALGAVDGGPAGPSWKFLSDNAETALVEAARGFLPTGTVIVLGGALLTNLTALNATIYSSSRVSFAMGRDRNLPGAFARVHPRRRTPATAIWASGAIVLVIAVALPIGSVAAAADIMFLLLFLLVNVSYVKLRHTLPTDSFGYRAPWFPVLPLIGIATKCVLAYVLLTHTGVAAIAAVAWIGVGVALYYAYVRPHEARVERRGLEIRTVHVAEATERRDYRILVPVANPAHADVLGATAGAIARGLNAEVHLLYVVRVPRATLPSEGRAFVAEAVPVLRRAERAIGGGVPVHTLVRIGHEIPSVIREAAVEKGVNLVLLGWRGQSRFREFVFGSTLDELVENPPCDVAVLKMRGAPRYSRILVPTHGGMHAPLSIRAGTAVGKSEGATVVLYNVVPSGERDDPDYSEEARAARGRGLLAQNAVAGADARLDLEYADDVVSAVAKKARDFDLVIVGATTEPVWRNYLFGDRTEEIAGAVRSAVLMVKAHQGPTAHSFRRLAQRLRGWKKYLRPHKARAR